MRNDWTFVMGRPLTVNRMKNFVMNSISSVHSSWTTVVVLLNRVTRIVRRRMKTFSCLSSKFQDYSTYGLQIPHGTVDESGKFGSPRQIFGSIGTNSKIALWKKNKRFLFALNSMKRFSLRVDFHIFSIDVENPFSDKSVEANILLNYRLKKKNSLRKDVRWTSDLNIQSIDSVDIRSIPNPVRLYCRDTFYMSMHPLSNCTFLKRSRENRFIFLFCFCFSSNFVVPGGHEVHSWRYVLPSITIDRIENGKCSVSIPRIKIVKT